MSDYSSEFHKAVEKNWHSPREREKLGEAMRRKDARLDEMVRSSETVKTDTSRSLQQRMAESLEERLHPYWRKGEISGGARRHLLLPSHS